MKKSEAIDAMREEFYYINRQRAEELLNFMEDKIGMLPPYTETEVFNNEVGDIFINDKVFKLDHQWEEEDV